MAYLPLQLDGKVALITGGNGGIGLGMAEALAHAGADIVVWGLNGEKNEAARRRLDATGRRVLVSQISVANEDAVIEGVQQALATFGRLDFVAANAGVRGGGTAFEDLQTPDWRRVLSVNLDGVFWTLREACKHMVARAGAGDPGGSLLAVASTSVVHGAPRNQAYAASKGALLPMIKGLAVEYGKHGIRANAILPGWTRSDMTSPLQNSDIFNAKAIGRVPVRRWGEPEDFGGIAVYLASDASRFHTGDVMVIDGGYTVF